MTWINVLILILKNLTWIKATVRMAQIMSCSGSSHLYSNTLKLDWSLLVKTFAFGKVFKQTEIRWTFACRNMLLVERFSNELKSDLSFLVERFCFWEGLQTSWTQIKACLSEDFACATLWKDFQTSWNQIFKFVCRKVLIFPLFPFGN